MLETSQSGILEGELETDLRKTVQMGCLDIIKPSERTALAFYSTNVLREYSKRVMLSSLVRDTYLSALTIIMEMPVTHSLSTYEAMK